MVEKNNNVKKNITGLTGAKILFNFMLLIWEIPSYLFGNVQTRLTGRVTQRSRRRFTVFITPNLLENGNEVFQNC